MRSVLWFIVAVVCSGLVCACATAQPTKDRTPITAAFADWQKRQKMVKTARYVVSGTAEFLKPLSADSPVHPVGDRTRPYAATVLLDFEQKRLRFEASYFVPVEGGGFQKRVSTMTNDGAEQRQSQQRDIAEANGGFDLLISKGPRSGEAGTEIPSEVAPLYFAHGLIPTAHQPAYLERLPLSWPADDFVTHGRHTLRGNVCQVLRTEPQLGIKGLADEYWIQPDRKSAILRYVVLSDGQPWTRLDIDWTETPSGWLPRSWTHTLTGNGKDVNRIHSLSVTHFELNPAVKDADFTIPAVPGMKQVIVAEQAPQGVRVHPGHPGRRTYRITDNGEWVEVDSQGWKSLVGKDIPLPTRRGWWLWPVGGVVMFISGWLVYRWRGRRTSPAPSASL